MITVTRSLQRAVDAGVLCHSPSLRSCEERERNESRRPRFANDYGDERKIIPSRSFKERGRGFTLRGTVIKELRKIVLALCITPCLILVYTNCGTESNVPVLISPEDGGTVAENPPTFVWGSIEGYNTYWLQVSENDAFSTTVISTLCYADTSYTPSNPLNSGDYYWRVCAQEGG